MCATSDRSSMERARAAFTATALAEGFRRKGQRVLLLIDNAEVANETASEAAGCEEVFQLLAGLSDDFMADGRQQPAMQARTDL